MLRESLERAGQFFAVMGAAASLVFSIVSCADGSLVSSYFVPPTAQSTSVDYISLPLQLVSSEEGEVAGSGSKLLEQLEALYPHVFASYLSYRFKPWSSSYGVREALDERFQLIGYRNAMLGELPTDWIKKGLFETRYGADRINDFQDSGLIGRVLIHNESPRIIVAFAGIFLDHPPSMLNAFAVWGGYGFGYLSQIVSWLVDGEYQPVVIPMLRRALSMTRDLQQHYPDHTIELTGLSLGGAIAQYVAIKTGLKAKVFNSLALNSAIYQQLLEEVPGVQPDRLITHAYVEGELLNGASFSSFIQGTFDKIGVHGRIPATGLVIPVSKGEPSLYGVDQFWSRHEIPGLLRAVEAFLSENGSMNWTYDTDALLVKR